MIPLKVALIGRSNHWHMNRIMMESRFSITHVVDRLATVSCQESFESRYLWYKSNLFVYSGFKAYDQFNDVE